MFDYISAAGRGFDLEKISGYRDGKHYVELSTDYDNKRCMDNEEFSKFEIWVDFYSGDNYVTLLVWHKVYTGVFIYPKISQLSVFNKVCFPGELKKH